MGKIGSQPQIAMFALPFSFPLKLYLGPGSILEIVGGGEEKSQQ